MAFMRASIMYARCFARSSRDCSKLLWWASCDGSPQMLLVMPPTSGMLLKNLRPKSNRPMLTPQHIKGLGRPQQRQVRVIAERESPLATTVSPEPSDVTNTMILPGDAGVDVDGPTPSPGVIPPFYLAERGCRV